MSRRVYVDHAATSPMLPEARAAWLDASSLVGNPSSLHASGRAARRIVEEARESIAADLNARPSAVVFTSGGTEADNLAIKGFFWALRDQGSAPLIVTSAVEHHAVLDPIEWLVAHEGALVHWLGVDPTGRISIAELEQVLSKNPHAFVSIMWANNEIGTVMPVADIARVCREFGVPFHTDAVQVLGQIPIDVDELGADAITIASHKIGGPFGVGALILDPQATVTPVLHGGGQEREIRSGTLDAAAVAGFAAAVRVTVARVAEHAEHLRALQTRLIEGISAVVPDAILNGPKGTEISSRLPANVHFSFPGCEGDSLLMLLDAAGVDCSTGSACTAGIPEPSHVLLALGASENLARGSLRFSLGRNSTQQDVDTIIEVLPAAVDRALRAGRVSGGARMRVIAAMSGGVDSSVAAARLVDAGHEVIGVHLALAKSARTSGKQRGCCTLDDARDARRVADVLGIPFYVWDFSERFAEDVMDNFLSEYQAGRTPNPCLRCNEHVKFSAVLDRAMALGFDAVGTGHYARRIDGPNGAELHRAADPLKDQSYVLSVLSAKQIEHSLFPLGDDIKGAVRAEATERGLITAAKPDSHDICFIPDGDTAGFLVDRLGEAAGNIVDAVSGEVLGQHRGTFTVTIGQRRGLDLRVPAEDGTPRYVVDIDMETRNVIVGSPDLLDVHAIEATHPIWCGASLDANSRELLVQVRAHSDPVPAQVRFDGETVRVELIDPIRGLAPGQTVAIFDGTRVVGSATIDATDRIAAREPLASTRQ